MKKYGEKYYTPKQLTHRLKQFAFNQSPQFKSGVIDNVHLNQIFDLSFDVRPEADHDMDGVTDRMRLTLGFQAMRGASMDNTDQDYYHFAVNCSATRAVDPNELRLSPEDWYVVADEYDIDTEDLDESDMPRLVQSELDVDGTYCMQYIESDYTIATSDNKLQLTEEYGYKVGDEKYGSVEREDFYEIDGIGHYDQAPDRLIADDSSATIDDFVQFNAMVADMRRDIDQTGDLMAYASKQREMLFVLNCLRSHTIPTQMIGPCPTFGQILKLDSKGVNHG